MSRTSPQTVPQDFPIHADTPEARKYGAPVPHSPGPWGCSYTSNWCHEYRIGTADGKSLPINAPCNDRSEQRANARLIAAAPDLLEALLLMIQQFKHVGSDEACTAILMARLAVSRALVGDRT